MGVDVEFKVRPSPMLTREKFDDIRRRFYEAYPDSDVAADNHHFPHMDWDNYEPAPTIQVSSLDRYYGLGYERGPWPAIRAMGEWLAANIPGELRYGGDSDDSWEALRPWPEIRAQLDAWWREHKNEPYRRGFIRR